MSVRLRPIVREDLPRFCAWRAAARSCLRTPFVLTLDQQIQWYEDVVCDRRATARYWAIEAVMFDAGVQLVGVGGLTDIEWENGRAEISLVLDPGQTRQGYGRAACDLLLAEAFDAMRLETVGAEVYQSNPALGFWEQMAETHHASRTTLPRRKFWGGAYHDAVYFSFTRPR